jgi:hypothetical protein
MGLITLLQRVVDAGNVRKIPYKQIEIQPPREKARTKGRTRRTGRNLILPELMEREAKKREAKKRSDDRVARMLENRRKREQDRKGTRAAAGIDTEAAGARQGPPPTRPGTHDDGDNASAIYPFIDEEDEDDGTDYDDEDVEEKPVILIDTAEFHEETAKGGNIDAGKGNELLAPELKKEKRGREHKDEEADKGDDGENNAESNKNASEDIKGKEEQKEGEGGNGRFEKKKNKGERKKNEEEEEMKSAMKVERRGKGKGGKGKEEKQEEEEGENTAKRRRLGSEETEKKQSKEVEEEGVETRKQK